MHVSVLKSVWELHIISKLFPLLSELNKLLKRVYDSPMMASTTIIMKSSVSQFFTIKVPIVDTYDQIAEFLQYIEVVRNMMP
jgi:hypothetical protein